MVPVVFGVLYDFLMRLLIKCFYRLLNYGFVLNRFVQTEVLNNCYGVLYRLQSWYSDNNVLSRVPVVDNAHKSCFTGMNMK